MVITAKHKRTGLALFVLALLFSFFHTTSVSFASTAVYPRFHAFDVNGLPLVGGKLYTYLPGTTTNKAAYTDTTFLTPTTNPIILDANGEATFYLNGSYKFVLKTPADVQLWSVDNVVGIPSATDPMTFASVTSTGNVVIGGALTVTGATTLSGGVAITGNSSVLGNSSIGGNQTVTGTLGVTGNIDFDGDLDLAKAATIHQTLYVVGAQAIGGDLTVTGDIVGQSFRAGIAGYKGLYKKVTAGTTSGTGEDTIATYTMPADTFDATSNILHIVASGYVTDTATANKTIKFYFGSSVWIFYPAATAAGEWRLDAYITRVDATNQYASVIGYRETGIAFQEHLNGAGSNPAEDTAAEIIIKITGECANAGDVVVLLSCLIEAV